MGHLSQQDLDTLFSAIVKSGHLQDGTWSAALSRLNPAYHAMLPLGGGNPSAALMQTLSALDRTGRLIDGTIPIEVVLAQLKLLSSIASVVDLSSSLLAKVEGKTGMGTPPGRSTEYSAAQPEAYVGESDDTLPFDFLLTGHTTGRAVARLLVPRFEGGLAAINSQGEQQMYRGTGWLIAPDLFITNYHVVCARESDETDEPDAADLDLQIANTTIQLDYDRTKAAAREITGAKLVARGARGGARDYALLRVTPLADWPKPLRLRVQPPLVPKEGYAVNIIQHPQGWPKRLAVRSNLLKSANGNQLEYFGDTLGGSSGSPLCNDAWEVIGLHRASGPSTNVTVKGKTAAAYNLGIPIAAVVNDLAGTAIAAEIAPSICQ